MKHGLLFDSDAVFSPEGAYRYLLYRRWAPESKPLLNFLLLNPSMADANRDDPTVSRCRRRASLLGFGGLVITNLFAYKATAPADMLATTDPVGPGNDAAILAAALEASLVICAWGVHGRHRGRSARVLEMLREAGHGPKLHYLAMAAGGEPVHPLYLRRIL